MWKWGGLTFPLGVYVNSSPDGFLMVYEVEWLMRRCRFTDVKFILPFTVGSSVLLDLFADDK